MDFINEEKLQAVGDELIGKLRSSGEALIDDLLAKLDGWTATVTITLHKPVPKVEQK